jgi:hypothetical protein
VSAVPPRLRRAEPVPKFCRHNRLLQNCPICSREQEVELRPIVTSSTPRVAEPRERPAGSATRRERSRQPGARTGVRVRHIRNSTDDGFRSPLTPGLRSSQEAERLAEEIAFAATRLRLLREAPPGLYGEVAGGESIEERTWLAFLIAYLYPTESEDPFAGIRAVRTSWVGDPDLSEVETGPRTAHDPSRGTRTLEAYRAWAARAGSQAAAFAGETGWGAERRFARTFERLALPGLHRAARFELLSSLGALGLYELKADSLHLGGDDEVTVAAKRALAIGDTLLLERRAAQLAQACQVPLEALDLGLYNWESETRASGGLGPDAEAAADERASVGDALGI